MLGFNSLVTDNFVTISMIVICNSFKSSITHYCMTVTSIYLFSKFQFLNDLEWLWGTRARIRSDIV